VANKTFRADLFYRLNVMRISIPALRERSGDAVLLFLYFLQKTCHERGQVLPKILPGAMKALQCYDWPGNVREARNLAEQVMTLHYHTDTIGIDDLPMHFRLARPETQTSRAILKTQQQEWIRQVLQECDGNITRAAAKLGIHRSTLYRKLSQCDSNHGKKTKRPQKRVSH
jgi:transcriptional regulator with PAS, ATPase and Fis domain